MDLRNCQLSDVVKAVEADPALAWGLLKHDDEPDGVTMLWQACALGQTSVAEYLLGLPGSSEPQQHQGQGDASAEGVVAQPAMKIDVNFQRQKGRVSCLYIAAQNGQANCCKMLLEHGALVDLPRDTGATPLFIAAQRNFIEVVEMLLKAGAAVDAKNNQGCSPFVLACSMGHKDIALKLLEGGADFHDNDTGSTCAQWAKKEGKQGMYVTLLHMILVLSIQRGRCFELWKKFTEQRRAPFKQIALDETSHRVDVVEREEASAMAQLHSDFEKTIEDARRLSGETPLPPFEVLTHMPIPVEAVSSKEHPSSVINTAADPLGGVTQVLSPQISPKVSFRQVPFVSSSAQPVDSFLGASATALEKSLTATSDYDALQQLIETERNAAEKAAVLQNRRQHKSNRASSGVDLTRTMSFERRHKEIQLKDAREAVKRAERELEAMTSRTESHLSHGALAGIGHETATATNRLPVKGGTAKGLPSPHAKVAPKRKGPPEVGFMSVGNVAGVSNAEYFLGSASAKKKAIIMMTSTKLNANLPGRVNVTGETPGGRVDMLPSYEAMKMFARFPTKNFGLETKRKRNEESASPYRNRDSGISSVVAGSGTSRAHGDGEEILFPPQRSSFSPSRTPHKSVVVDSLLQGSIPKSAMFETSQAILADYRESSSYRPPSVHHSPAPRSWGGEVSSIWDSSSSRLDHAAVNTTEVDRIISRVDEYTSPDILQKMRLRNEINRQHVNAPLNGNINVGSGTRNAIDGSLNVSSTSPHAVYLEALAAASPMINSPYNKIAPDISREIDKEVSRRSAHHRSITDVASEAGVQVARADNFRRASAASSSSRRSDPHAMNGTSNVFPYGVSNRSLRKAY